MTISEIKYEFRILRKLEKEALKQIKFDEFNLDLKTLTLDNSVAIHSSYKNHLDLIHERLKLIDSLDARKLAKDFDDALNGSYSIFDT